jgi:hypothetical protein
MARNILASTRSLKEGNLYGYSLPKGLVGLKITQVGQVYQLRTTSLRLQPDPQHQYFFKYQPSAFTDDDITLEFSSEGYLKKICTIIDDQTDEFINKVADLGTNLAETLAGVGTRSLAERVIAEVEVDPFDEKAMGQLNAYLKQTDQSMELTARMLGQAASGGEEITQRAQSGVYFKPHGTCELTLSSQAGEFSAQARIPHPHQLGFVAIPQAAWVKTTFTMTFDEAGVPNKIEVKKPSSAMALIELPINILKAIVSIPSQLIQLRVNLQNDRRGALSAQMESDKQMKALQDQLAAYREEQRATQTRSLNGGDNGAASTSQPATRSGGETTPVDHAQWSQMQNQVKKMEQDLLTLRRRLNDQP